MSSNLLPRLAGRASPSSCLLKRSFPTGGIRSRACRMAAKATSVFQGEGSAELRSRNPGKCSSSTPLVGKEELQQALKALPAWSLNGSGTQIARSFVAKNFVAAIDFFEEVAKLAEEANHHPDLHLTSYRNVEIVLSTHAIGGIGEPDLVLAAKIDALPVDYSPKWLKQQEEKLAPVS